MLALKFVIKKSMQLLNAKFVDAICYGLEVIGYNFHKSEIKNCDFTEAKLTSCALETVKITDTKLNQTTMDKCRIGKETSLDKCSVDGLELTASLIANKGVSVTNCTGTPKASSIANALMKLNGNKIDILDTMERG